MTREELFRFLSGHRYGVLATVAGDKSPEAALVGIAVAPDLRLVFDAINTTRKCHNLRRNPHIAFVVGWEDEQTVQYEGVAEFPEGNGLDEIQRIYAATWPQSPMRDMWPGHIYVQVRPRWIRYSSYLKLPWQIEEIRFP